MTTNKTRIAVFCSGGGSNFKSIYRSIAEKPLNAEIVLCLSNRSQCGAMEFAHEQGIATVHITEKQFDSFDEFADAMVTRLKDAQIDVVLLAGYMRKVPDAVVRAFPERMLNIHPALLPKFGGEGMYGIHVHSAVIAAGEKESGATVHFVNEEYDKGKILLQRAVPVLQGDTPEILAARVLACEHQLYPDALEKLLAEQRS
ncbi:phosphoribosylglycinamide formyltransferase [Pelodictyon phaeoclathratiforme]|jgi:phosphoribosylglycinamide formyltransferase-1|uniref:Phosphoribosylglycinamide formyltransferase n=1 Tax=Pelodictyon phaeoclathratiforme (strain DSM 5477 / BU-1) TaxID=324925 RepID=B4SE55_PELPB|nr:phosphoribosylglycinamide formyltransferase [Pelodictyon phaeoclathratiforme]ACF44474.1 phosphoribosylglycinamide formyltransferase [Pelodictyon phaeoclathratiforme BU-1]MBV5290439.1 phosphoribosylglycinamide formyltransferase [Pelodictyon phaeoclathratiforme]